MEAGTGGSTSDALKEAPPLASDKDENDHFVRLSSSSESSCSSFDPYRLDEHEIMNSSSAVNGHPKPEKASHSSFRYDHEDGTPNSSLLVPEHSGNQLAEPSVGRTSDGSLHSSSSSGSIMQCPQVQVMQRTSDLDSGSPSPYRIPSSVFARTTTTAQEWSVTSNESLFSIHTGNMSFTKDMYWMYKSGELGRPGDPIMSPSMKDYSSNQPPPPLVDYTSNQPSPPLVDYSSNQPLPPLVDNPSSSLPSSKLPSNSIDIFKTNANLYEGLRATPEAVETMKSVLRENAEADREKERLSHAEGASCHSATASPSHHSSASGASTKSFAFPILGGDGAKSGSSKVAPGSIRQHSQSVRPNLEPQSPQPQTRQERQTAKATAPVDTGQTRWFSCFSCCSFCS
ncbi:hypothetical protein CDL15_Pgr008819 [Punica granatum]|nr:hypothetical protein CDL15_Pgr008819 [Punica granatum]